jgi:hypothetical protein
MSGKTFNKEVTEIIDEVGKEIATHCTTGDRYFPFY